MWLFCLIFFLSFQVPTVHGDQLEKTWQIIEVWQLLDKVDSQKRETNWKTTYLTMNWRHLLLPIPNE